MNRLYIWSVQYLQQNNYLKKTKKLVFSVTLNIDFAILNTCAITTSKNVSWFSIKNLQKMTYTHVRFYLVKLSLKDHENFLYLVFDLSKLWLFWWCLRYHHTKVSSLIFEMALTVFSPESKRVWQNWLK